MSSGAICQCQLYLFIYIAIVVRISGHIMLVFMESVGDNVIVLFTDYGYSIVMTEPYQYNQ